MFSLTLDFKISLSFNSATNKEINNNNLATRNRNLSILV